MYYVNYNSKSSRTFIQKVRLLLNQVSIMIFLQPGQ